MTTTGFLADEPITAAHESPVERLFRFVRRNLTWVQAAAISFVILFLVLIGIWLFFATWR
jgi:hypothetical protein